MIITCTERKKFRLVLALFNLTIGEKTMYKFKNSEIHNNQRSYRRRALALSVLSLLAFTPAFAMEATDEQIKNEVKSSYGAIAKSGKPCFSCC